MSGIRGLRGLYFRFLPASIRSLASAAQQPMAVNSYLDQWVKIWDVCVEIGACLKVWHILIIIYWSSNIHFSILTSMGSSYMNKHLKKWILLVSMHHHSFNLKPKAFKRFAGLFPWAILARAISTEKAIERRSLPWPNLRICHWKSDGLIVYFFIQARWKSNPQKSYNNSTLRLQVYGNMFSHSQLTQLQDPSDAVKSCQL